MLSSACYTHVSIFTIRTDWLFRVGVAMLSSVAERLPNQLGVKRGGGREDDLAQNHGKLEMLIGDYAHIMNTERKEYRNRKELRRISSKNDETDQDQWNRFIGVAASGQEQLKKCLSALTLQENFLRIVAAGFIKPEDLAHAQTNLQEVIGWEKRSCWDLVSPTPSTIHHYLHCRNETFASETPQWDGIRWLVLIGIRGRIQTRFIVKNWHHQDRVNIEAY
ncbi:uncharacterized protein CIMG_13116 [Coccidioides immitis RS]|uniref:Uncharacterized protein n=1 Tax=Coccidioides immitis (strain RS) TaxID=246410 RepID=A0A0D8JTQ9_COCIM|nr:uncharacterized protein CIMG_13116 [Coccidioides immitis RS]KJF60667.1 hypothetical protein CIMG_13116 [Coccidioides immitis RS]